MENQGKLEIDLIPTSSGDLKITFLGHGSLLFNFQDKNIYIDPYSRVADYSKLPPADIILITHEHHDHLDLDALKHIQKSSTTTVMTKACAEQTSGDILMANGDEQTVQGIHIRAVPAYNIVHKRPNGQPFHPKGMGNGYILTFGDLQVYIAGDTENIPEMQTIKDIDVAFLPMNLPYTMTPEMVADAALALRPRLLYPYHFGSTNTSRLTELLHEEADIEVRIRNMA
ncbi:MAG: MBL fold metallo-hydrolase [Chloroflexi bacterium]|nr:MAG: MBL fold metallo-hydrolase [Chloroflexota bacterium]